jgi:methyl-accepting chemotaxis protein
MKNKLAPGSLKSNDEKAVGAVDGALAALCGVLLPVWMRHLQTSKDQSDVAVQRMLHSFAGIEGQLKQCAELAELSESPAQENVESMYMALQYQDRYGQMLSLLHEDMGRLLAMIRNPTSVDHDFDAAKWLANLESKYAMTEQHGNHSGKSDEQQAADNETSFF